MNVTVLSDDVIRPLSYALCNHSVIAWISPLRALSAAFSFVDLLLTASLASLIRSRKLTSLCLEVRYLYDFSFSLILLFAKMFVIALVYFLSMNFLLFQRIDIGSCYTFDK